MHSNGSGSGEEERIPRLAPDFDPKRLDLTPIEGFLLSRIDGHTSWKTLRHIGGLAPEDVDRTLERFAKQGVIVVESPASARAPRTAAPRQKQAAPQSDIDARLGIPVELQRRVLDFERQLERPYHEILGVDSRADAKEIKRAYFRLSREYHPDRYFRRNVGPFGARFEKIFKKVSEAYELLSDPTTRAEIERSLASMPPSAQEEGAYRGVPENASERIGPGPARPRGYRVPGRMENLEKLRSRFKIPRKVLAERRLKAEQLFRAARVSAHEGRPLEAAASMRLAIAFDPWNDAFKAGFADIQGQVYTARAAELVRQAGEATSASDALRLLEEALTFRPCDIEALRRVVAACIELNELARAREYAEQLCELEPEVAGHHARLAGVLRRQGLRERASSALERGHAIDPKDPDVKGERLLLRRSLLARQSGGTA